MNGSIAVNLKNINLYNVNLDAKIITYSKEVLRMPTEYELAEIEKIAAIVYIIASVAIVRASIKTQKIEINKRRGIKSTNTGGLTPAQLVVLGDIIFLVGSVLFERTARVRLKQVEMQAMKDPSISVIPNKYITLSEVFFVVGGIIGIIGAQLKAQEAEVAIV